MNLPQAQANAANADPISTFLLAAQNAGSAAYAFGPVLVLYLQENGGQIIVFDMSGAQQRALKRSPPWLEEPQKFLHRLSKAQTEAEGRGEVDEQRPQSALPPG